MYSKILLLRPTKIKTTSLLRPVFASLKWYFPYDIIFNIKTTSLIRPFWQSKGGLSNGILLYLEKRVFVGISTLLQALCLGGGRGRGGR